LLEVKDSYFHFLYDRCYYCSITNTHYELINTTFVIELYAYTTLLQLPFTSLPTDIDGLKKTV